MWSLLAQLITVAPHIQEKFLELRQERVRLLDGEEFLKRWFHGRLSAQGQAVGEHAGEVSGADLGLRLLYVVLDEAVEDARLVLVMLG